MYVVDPVTESTFAAEGQSTSQHWRSIVLFGSNVASYKFALAKALLEIAASDRNLISLEELAVPFSRHVCEHLKEVDRQGTFEHSRFLDGCRFFNAGRISANELVELTVLLGFNNVLDAFHNVRSQKVPTQFFVDERTTHGGIQLTNDMFGLAEAATCMDLIGETESRWRLVESAWAGRATGDQVTVLYDSPHELLVSALKGHRRPITEIRPALNGYQKGHCFYCRQPISFTSLDAGAPVDVDHFFGHVLMSRGLAVDLDVPWNLVLACQDCNRGVAGKGPRLPHPDYLKRLWDRNEYLIASNHPLRETLIATTGADPEQRWTFLTSVLSESEPLAGSAKEWRAPTNASTTI
jgi:hypothetical protein